MSDIFSQYNVTDIGHPVLMLAPMEGITGPSFRSLLTDLPGVDMVATEFVRITSTKQRIKPLPRYRCPLQLQIMGTSPEILRGAVEYLQGRALLGDSDWLDLNVGCPSKRVTSKGAGSALLCTPHKLVDLIHTLRETHKGPLSIKTRVGFQSAEDYPNIISALADCPLDFISIHARTRADGYHNPVHLEHLAYAVQHLPYPVIGNGEVWTVHDALHMLKETGVRGVMCGRGATANPFLFCEIKAALRGETAPSDPTVQQERLYAFALRLCALYQEEGLRVDKPQLRLGTFKEFCIWFSRNPLVGRQFFQDIKRAASLEEMALHLQALHQATRGALGTSRPSGDTVHCNA